MMKDHSGGVASNGSRRFYDFLPKDGVIRKSGRIALRTLHRASHMNASSTDLSHPNLWQQHFCVWNAARLGISPEKSFERYRRSWSSIKDGHAGPEFRRHAMLHQDLLSVVADDSPGEVYASYKLHEWMHFLAQLCHPVPRWTDAHPVLRQLGDRRDVTIIDFGCGLAQTSISLAQSFQAKQKEVSVFLADIPTVRADFLKSLCAHVGIPATVGVCTPAQPIPEIPRCQVVVAVEFFEHVHQPLEFFDRLNHALEPGGFLITNVDDHQREFMHVSPNLEQLRTRLNDAGYETVERYQLYRKR